MAPRDLDAARAARREAMGDQPSVILGGREYKLVVEPTYELAEALQSRDTAAMVKALLDDPAEADAFLANRLTPLDLDGMIEEFGLHMGESSASSAS